MRVRLAEFYGMCFGVRDAVGMALQLAEQGPVTILGDLVHNPDVIARMEDAGALRVNQPSDVQTNTVLLTAHGTTDHVKRELRDNGKTVVDAVCPLVTRVRKSIDALLAEDRHPVVIGKAGHVEVRGLVGDLASYSIVLSAEDLDQLEGKPRLGIVAQTTQPLEIVQGLVDLIRRRFVSADIRFVDTVCQPTKDRQDAMRRLVSECDVIVVVGGPDSNNSRHLTALAAQLGRPAYQVASARELREEWFTSDALVGLTAGTSTPDYAVQEVRTWLESH